jgi:hypothetical protein
MAAPVTMYTMLVCSSCTLCLAPSLLPQVYTVGSGKTMPAWLSEAKKRALRKDEDYRWGEGQQALHILSPGTAFVRTLLCQSGLVSCRAMQVQCDACCRNQQPSVEALARQLQL